MMLVACGGRTPLEVPTADGSVTIDAMQPLPDWRVSAAVRCGLCQADPWCALSLDVLSPDRAVYSDCSAGQNPPCTRERCENQNHGRWVDQPTAAINARGEEEIVYCLGQTLRQLDPHQCAAAPLPYTRDGVDGCLMTEESARRWSPGFNGVGYGRDSTGAPGTRAQVCPSGQYRCDQRNTGTTAASPRTDTLASFTCPKGIEQHSSEPHPVCRREVSFPASNRPVVESRAFRYFGAYANMFGDSSLVGMRFPRLATAGDPDPLRARLLPGGATLVSCFTTRQTMDFTEHGAIYTPDNDPAIPQLGQRTVLLPTSRLVVELPGSRTQPSTPVLGEAYVLVQGGNFSLSWLRLRLPQGPFVVQGVPLTGGRLFLEHAWNATYDAHAPGPNLSFDLSSLRAQVELRAVNQYLLSRPQASSALGTLAGDRVSLRFSFPATGGQPFTYRLELDLQLLPRPTAVIAASVPTTLRCQDHGAFVGAELPATGETSPPSALSYWSVNGASERTRTSALDPAPVSFRLGPQLPGAPVTLALTVLDAELAETAVRTIEVRDEDPPTVSSTHWDVPCTWGLSVRPDPQQPYPCARIDGAWTDPCSPAHAEVSRVRVYDRDTHTLLADRVLQGGTCLLPEAPYLDLNLANAEYEVEWQAVDAWGNRSVARYWRGYFVLDLSLANDLPTPGVCTTTVRAVTLEER